MKRFSLTALLASAVLFVTMGTSTLSAEMKCGAGKCGAAMEKPACCKTPAGELKKIACCDSVAAGKECTCPEAKMAKKACCEAAASGKACTCPDAVKCQCKDKNNCTCPAGKKAPPAAMKCGTGKCG